MVTIALRVSSVASFLAVEPSVHPPQLKPMIIVAIAPTAAPCSSRFSDSPCRIAGNCTEFPFADMFRSEAADTRTGSGSASWIEERTLWDGDSIISYLRFRLPVVERNSARDGRVLVVR